MPRDELHVGPNGSLTVVTVYDEDEEKPAVASVAKPKPFGGKGDHDNNGKVGGVAPARATTRGKRKKRGR